MFGFCTLIQVIVGKINDAKFLFLYMQKKNEKLLKTIWPDWIQTNHKKPKCKGQPSLTKYKWQKGRQMHWQTETGEQHQSISARIALQSGQKITGTCKICHSLKIFLKKYMYTSYKCLLSSYTYRLVSPLAREKAIFLANKCSLF